MYSRYPILSSIIILPLGVVRLMKLRNPNSISDSGEFVGVAFIAVSGILNAALYLMTRRRLLWGDSRAVRRKSEHDALFHVEANGPHSAVNAEMRHV
jgi:hypothetical protein